MMFVRIPVILAAVFVAGLSIADPPLEQAATPKEVRHITESISKLRHPAPWEGYQERLGLTNLKGAEIIGGSGSLGLCDEVWDLGLGGEWLLIVERTSYHKGETLDAPILATCMVVRGSVADYKAGRLMNYEVIRPSFERFTTQKETNKG